MTHARNGAASAAPEGLVYQVQVRYGKGWTWPTELGDTRHESAFASAGEADEARERLIEEYDYGTDAVRVLPCVVEDERGGVFPVRDPRPRSGRRVETPDTIKLRLPEGYKARLLAICEHDAISASEWVAGCVDDAEAEAAKREYRARRKRPAGGGREG